MLTFLRQWRQSLIAGDEGTENQLSFSDTVTAYVVAAIRLNNYILEHPNVEQYLSNPTPVELSQKDYYDKCTRAAARECIHWPGRLLPSVASERWAKGLLNTIDSYKREVYFVKDFDRRRDEILDEEVMDLSGLEYVCKEAAKVLPKALSVQPYEVKQEVETSAVHSFAGKRKIIEANKRENEQNS
jgi:hypothetical protein